MNTDTTDKKPWFVFGRVPENSADPQEIMLYGDIGAWGVSASDFIAQAKAVPAATPLRVRINSTGGNIFDALAMFNWLRARGNVETVVDGLAASSGSLVAMAGKKRVMPKCAYLMVHKPWSGAVGNGDQLRQQADLLDKFADMFADAYVAATGIAKAVVVKAMEAESWIVGSDAKKQGWVTDLNDAEPVQASIAPTRYTKTPSQFLAQAGSAKPCTIKGAAPSEIEVDDDVTWTESDGTIRFGYVTEIQRTGTLSLPDLALSLNATPENPAAVVETYKELAAADGTPSGTYVESEEKILLPFSRLTPAEDLSVLSSEGAEGSAKTKNHTMQKLLAALAQAGVISSPNLGEDAAVAEFTAKFNALNKQLVDAQSALVAQAKANATALVEAAVTEGRIKADVKDSWITQIVANADAAKLLAAIEKPKTVMGAVPVGPSSPNVPDNTKPKTLTEQCIEARAKQAAGAK